MGNSLSCNSEASLSCTSGAGFLDAASRGLGADLAFRLQDDIQLLKHSSLKGNTAWHVAAKANRLDILNEMVR